MHLVWTREALNKLSEIEKYISQDSPDRAITFVDYLIERGDALKDHPNIGRVVPEIGKESIRELIAKNYRIIYRIDRDRIEILTVFEGHRLLRDDELKLRE
jgi:toxin ParE1/3/4